MNDWAPRRFWTLAASVPRDGGWAVDLDGRAVKTPYKSALIVPSRAMADAIAAEWQAQGERIDPGTMPVTRATNSAIDKVAPQRDDVAALLAAYGESDLLCYRATQPDALIARQNAAWDPWLAWSAQALDAPLHVTSGIMPVDQPQASLDRLHVRVRQLDNFAMTGFYDLVQLSGSLVLALAVIAGKLPAAQAWDISRIDEDFQISQWGDDDDAAAVAALKRQAFLHAETFVRMSSAD
ncbi:Chaperone required for the assembly of the F1-ATPase [Loktanella fryxellensis]|uniref:Chaperone required for the assembly of the F1-ATPase n=1 Tax=Loktanella fryxellensis TaxID=245187 RepID=A0A1H8A4P9_9RHOB|nr:ATP12 family protein [Loktanella fryxellensis]SEM65670.1 Chaperone required for the assembly of the F1-ATPase [Loktanella fryxellensis]